LGEENEGKTIIGSLAVEGRHIEIDVLEVRWGGVEWIDFAYFMEWFGALMIAVINFGAP